MPRINSRSKGRRGERKAAQVLEQWTSYKFHRVPASGGLRWKTANTIGDLVCGDPLHRFDFSLEVKNYADINFEHLLMPDVNSEILKFWEQCESDAQRGKKLPLLMMRYDGMKANLFFVVIRYSEFKILKPLLDRAFPYFKLGTLVFMNSNMLFNSKYTQVKKLTTKIIKKLW